MKKIFQLVFCLSSLAFSAHAKDENYSVSAIPDSLKKNAHAVIRYYESHYTINAPDEATLTQKIVVTVLDEKGKEMGDFFRYYNSELIIGRIDGTLYDKNGDEIRSLKKKDIIDAAALGSDMATDVRAKLHSFETQIYPYTTEYDIEIKCKTSLYIESWQPVPGEYCSSENSILTVDYPDTFPLRYKLIKLPSPKQNTIENKTTLTLEIKAFKARKEKKIYATAKDQQLPIILFATDTFSYYDHQGSMKSWRDFGSFDYKLNEHRDVLSDDMKSTVHRLTDTCRERKAKINILYHYLQKNTRYVSIQLGEGGWQTLDAQFVSDKKYGDCKALSNFMMAMLKEAGITAYCVLVRAARQQDVLTINETFPYDIFNHIILCVPDKTDTTWLECTAHDLPTGYLGSFTSNRKVLMVTPEGGKVIKTPDYGLETNIMVRKANLSLNDRDELTGSVVTESRGAFWESEYRFAKDVSKSDLDKFINNYLGFASYQATDASFKDFSSTGAPFLTGKMNVIATTEVTRSTGNLLLSTNVFKTNPAIVSGNDSMLKEFEIHSSYKIMDTVVINLNSEYNMNDQSKDINNDYPFGSIHLKYRLSDNKTLLKTTEYTEIAGVYPGEDFEKYKKMRNDIAKDASTKLILTKAK